MAVQDQVLVAIPALAKAHVMRYGYAVEYDSVLTSDLDHTLAVPRAPGLYLAGQICGTSGYEEAAIQGLLAGANAALSLQGQEPLIPGRGDGYCGVWSMTWYRAYQPNRTACSPAAPSTASTCAATMPIAAWHRWRQKLA